MQDKDGHAMNKTGKLMSLYILIPYFLIGAAGFFLFKKGEVEIWMNQFHNRTLDFFFRYWSDLGNGFIFIFLIAAFLFYRYYYVIMTLTIILIQTLMVQVLKMVIFRYVDRPILIFRNIPGIHYVKGVTMHLYQTFPSGHTATAFSVATLLFLAVKNKKLSLLWYALAILVALSRVYLLQHFFVDTYAGALIGIFATGISWFLLKISGALKSEL